MLPLHVVAGAGPGRARRRAPGRRSELTGRAAAGQIARRYGLPAIALTMMHRYAPPKGAQNVRTHRATLPAHRARPAGGGQPDLGVRRAVSRRAAVPAV